MIMVSAAVTVKLGKSIYIFLNKSRSRIFINILFEIDFETNISDKIFIEEKRFEAIICLIILSSNNKY